MFNGYYDDGFLEHYEKLPNPARKKMREAIKKWNIDNNYNSLEFKSLFRIELGMLYSIRVDHKKPPGYRVLGHYAGSGRICWFWVGPHDEYERILERLR